MQYPVPGNPDLARRVQSLLEPSPVVLDEHWSLDHGTWAVRFEKRARELIAAAEHESLIACGSFGYGARLSIPTPDDYLPLLYVLGLRGQGE